MVMIFLLLAGVAGVILLMGFGVIRSGSSDAVTDIATYTANTTHWTGFSQTFTATPLLVILIFGGMVAFGVWQYIRRWKVKNSG